MEVLFVHLRDSRGTGDWSCRKRVEAEPATRVIEGLINQVMHSTVRLDQVEEEEEDPRSRSFYIHGTAVGPNPISTRLISGRLHQNKETERLIFFFSFFLFYAQILRLGQDLLFTALQR